MTDAREVGDEERAREAWDIWRAEPRLFNAPNEVIAERITARVADAIRAEREACAKVADDAERMKWEFMDQVKRAVTGTLTVQTAADIAKAIRSRSEARP